MRNRFVDVFDRSGARLFSYSIVLEDGNCLDAEFEEAALILAESSGQILADEVVHLRACCDRHGAIEYAEIQAPAAPKRGKSAVVSLVKHRLKRAGVQTGHRSVRQVS
jgi:hypothetical protein